MAEGQQKDEPGWKQDAGKARFDLIDPDFVEGIARILEFGARKYRDRNWERGMSWGRCFGAAMRHCWAFWRGEERDPETGEHHLLHAACCIMFLHAYSVRKTGTDDRGLGFADIDKGKAGQAKPDLSDHSRDIIPVTKIVTNTPAHGEIVCLHCGVRHGQLHASDCENHAYGYRFHRGEQPGKHYNGDDGA